MTSTSPTAASTRGDQLATARVGMVGAGQLARMTQSAAIDLAVRLEVLAMRADEPAVLAGAAYQLGTPDDLEALVRLAETNDVVTLDHELVPNQHLAELVRRGHAVHPSPRAVLLAQDKLHARRELTRLGFPVPAFAEVRTRDDVARFAEAHGWPVVLKARMGGYDGRGVRVVADLETAAEAIAAGEWLVEAHVTIAQELAILGARRPSGEQVLYPLIETVQRDGICHELYMPATTAAAVTSAALTLGEELIRQIEAVGICAIELFVTPNGNLFVNELALRPHNSGHATIEASVTSQFHNHLRAVLDWPLGDTSMRAPAAALVNLLGSPEAPDFGVRLPEALAVPGAQVHLYGKSSRPGRKIGHVTVLADDLDSARAASREAAARLLAPQGGLP